MPPKEEGSRPDRWATSPVKCSHGRSKKTMGEAGMRGRASRQLEGVRGGRERWGCFVIQGAEKHIEAGGSGARRVWS